MDYFSKEEALSAYKDPEAAKKWNAAWVEIDGPDIHEERKNPHYKKSLDDDSAERSERAMQAGMMGGTDAFNEEMGWDLESPDGHDGPDSYDEYDRSDDF